MKNYYVIASDLNRPDESLRTVVSKYGITMPNNLLIDVLNEDEELIYTISVFSPNTNKEIH